jgi:hypothetical protein
MEMPVQKKTLMVVPSVPSPVRPLAEGLHTFVLLLIFLGVLTDMTRGSQPTGTMIGLVGSTMVCLIGFQGIRQSNVTLVGIYVVLTVALLTMAFCGLIQGVLAHGFLHVSGACLGAYNLQGMKPKRFFV